MAGAPPMRAMTLYKLEPLCHRSCDVQGPPPGQVENYTDTALGMLLVNMLWVFGVIWACWGLAAVLVLAWVINALITRLARLRSRDQA